jgi:hypothetical protein
LTLARAEQGPSRRCGTRCGSSSARVRINGRADALYVINDALEVMNRNRTNLPRTNEVID